MGCRLTYFLSTKLRKAIANTALLFIYGSYMLFRTFNAIYLLVASSSICVSVSMWINNP